MCCEDDRNVRGNSDQDSLLLQVARYIACVSTKRFFMSMRRDDACFSSLATFGLLSKLGSTPAYPVSNKIIVLTSLKDLCSKWVVNSLLSLGNFLLRDDILMSFLLDPSHEVGRAAGCSLYLGASISRPGCSFCELRVMAHTPDGTVRAMAVSSFPP